MKLLKVVWSSTETSSVGLSNINQCISLSLSRPSSVKLLPLRPPPIKSIPGRPPPPAISSASSANQIPPSKISPASSSSSQTSSSPPPPVSTTQSQRVSKKGPPLPPRPKPGHPLYNSYVVQTHIYTHTFHAHTFPQILVLIFQTSCLRNRNGPRCIALYDYEGEEEDELTFSQGDVIALLQLIGQEWGRGQIHGRIGIFPLNFIKVVEPLPQPVSSPEETAEEWAVALFDFPGQTAEDLSFHKGALIRVTEHVDAEWRRGRLKGREGLFPAAFTQPCQGTTDPPQTQYLTHIQPTSGVAKALFGFTAESEDELTLKVCETLCHTELQLNAKLFLFVFLLQVGDIITQVESVDEQWILGVVGGKRGIVPRNYISLL
uniref:SH3 domain-containing protein n=1 Tax=Mastacembelus armatus TaxID=205130 RepID=A0A3Q3RTZ5_9TELE